MSERNETNLNDLLEELRGPTIGEMGEMAVNSEGGGESLAKATKIKEGGDAVKACVDRLQGLAESYAKKLAKKSDVTYKEKRCLDTAKDLMGEAAVYLAQAEALLKEANAGRGDAMATAAQRMLNRR
jgi:hypothetical protein